jgi:hypothetical protein
LNSLYGRFGIIPFRPVLQTGHCKHGTHEHSQLALYSSDTARFTSNNLSNIHQGKPYDSSNEGALAADRNIVWSTKFRWTSYSGALTLRDVGKGQHAPHPHSLAHPRGLVGISCTLVNINPARYNPVLRIIHCLSRPN